MIARLFGVPSLFSMCSHWAAEAFHWPALSVVNWVLHTKNTVIITTAEAVLLSH